MRITPSDGSYSTFTEIVSGYRLFWALRHAVRLAIIDSVGPEGSAAEEILKQTAMKTAEGLRFLELLTNLGVLERYDGHFFLSQFSRKYLLRGSALSQFGVLEFEDVLMEKWRGLDSVLLQGQGTQQGDLPDEELRTRLVLFHKAMHEAAVVRSEELWDALSFLPPEGKIIDVGSGDGTYLRAFLLRHPRWSAVACDLPEVLKMASLPDDPSIDTYACNILDGKERGDFVSSYSRNASVLLLSNVLHCYSEGENAQILESMKDLLREGGLVVIHDFFTDANSIGAMYDGHMLANTYNGRTYTIDETKKLLQAAGFAHCREFLLPSASCAVVASERPIDADADVVAMLQREALATGFTDAEPVAVEAIRSEPWVRAKCSYGCALYGKKWSCPPHSMDAAGFQELLSCYTKALLVVGQAPLKEFQSRLLELEKTAFLRGLKKALVFSGGPCAWCETCPEERCRFPEKRRPSLESCGCDVFALAETAGIKMRPVRNKDDYVQFVGLLLVE